MSAYHHYHTDSGWYDDCEGCWAENLSNGRELSDYPKNACGNQHQVFGITLPLECAKPRNHNGQHENHPLGNGWS